MRELLSRLVSEVQVKTQIGYSSGWDVCILNFCTYLVTNYRRVRTAPAVTQHILLAPFLSWPRDIQMVRRHPWPSIVV